MFNVSISVACGARSWHRTLSIVMICCHRGGTGIGIANEKLPKQIKRRVAGSYIWPTWRPGHPASDVSPHPVGVTHSTPGGADGAAGCCSSLHVREVHFFVSQGGWSMYAHIRRRGGWGNVKSKRLTRAMLLLLHNKLINQMTRLSGRCRCRCAMEILAKVHLGEHALRLALIKLLPTKCFSFRIFATLWWASPHYPPVTLWSCEKRAINVASQSQKQML